MAAERPGKKLEGLVAALERALHQKGASIESPCRRLLDRDTGRPREHDVVITWEHGHHKIVTAVECRDRSRPVGVPDVEAFADKCVATGVQSGVIVSATGFRATARKKAAARSIVCMDLADAETFEWLATDTFFEYTRSFSVVNFVVPPGLLSRDTFDGALYSETGQKVPIKRLAEFALSRIGVAPMPDEPLDVEHVIGVPLVTKGWNVRGKDGGLHPIESIMAKVTTRITRTDTPISRHRYSGGGKDYSVATAPSSQGQVVMIQNDDGSTTVSLVPSKPSEA